MIHYNYAIVQEVGSVSTTQSSQDSPPVMQPINSQDSNRGNLVMDLEPTMHTNTQLQGGLSYLLDKIWFVFKLACVLIVLLIALSIFKSSKGDNGESAKSGGGRFSGIGYKLMSKFLGRDVSNDKPKVDIDNSNGDTDSGSPANSEDEEPIRPRDEDTPPRRSMEDNIPPRRDISNDIPPRRDISNDIPPRRTPTGRDIPPRRTSTGRDIPPRRTSTGRDIPPRRTPTGRNIPPRNSDNVIPPRNKDLWN